MTTVDVHYNYVSQHYTTFTYTATDLPAAGAYQVWTVLHNFDCHAADGTTPAARFFRRAFPDLFESVLSQIGELPLPRQRRQAIAVSD